MVYSLYIDQIYMYTKLCLRTQAVAATKKTTKKTGKKTTKAAKPSAASKRTSAAGAAKKKTQSGAKKPTARGGSAKAAYRPKVSYAFLLEIIMGLWCLTGVIFFTAHSKLVLRPFLFLYAIGFCYVGMLSMLQRKR